VCWVRKSLTNFRVVGGDVWFQHRLQIFLLTFMLLFYFFAGVAICLGVLSVRGGLRFNSYVRQELARPRVDYTPFVSLIAPFRGLDQGLRENFLALVNQDYPAYELIFVTGRADDPALAIVEEVRARVGMSGCVATRLVVSGEATDSGQKVHNLMAAVRDLDDQTKVIAFVDSDARPHEQWLRSWVVPLHDQDLGAASSYRWFVPLGFNPAGHLRAVWNASIASALGRNERKNFCWGGATAIRRETFEAHQVIERWRGSVSDDFTLTRVLHEAGLRIRFVPHCLTASFENCSFRELHEFTNRQIKITRVYAPHLWKAILWGGLFFSPVFFGGMLLVLLRAALGLSFLIPAVLISVIFGLGALKALIRWWTVRLALASYGPRILGNPLAQLFLWPVASTLFLYNAIVAAGSRRINWRGISYELKSPTEAVIFSREKQE